MDTEYSVGDYIYLDISFTSPYEIGKIKEFRRDIGGSILVKVGLYLRRKDVAYELMTDEDDEEQRSALDDFIDNKDFNNLSDNQKQLVRKRQLFRSQKSKVVPVEVIKGKCFVTFLNEAETLLHFTEKEDMFYYSVTLDPKFLVDRIEIRVGDNYQVTMPQKIYKCEDNYNRSLETLVWTPYHDLSDNQIDEFLKKTRFVETLPRALESSSLIASSAAASRDNVLLHGMNLLHQNNYDYKKAERSLYASCDRINATDELEKWSQSETELFEVGYKQYKKDFNKIRTIFLPWKSVQEIIEYYYMWKTTENYVRIQKTKNSDFITRIKMSKKTNYQPVISNYLSFNSLSCQKCKKSLHKYGVSLSDSSLDEFHLCQACWLHWKRYG